MPASDHFTAWDILDETNQLIQISGLDYHMLYANRPARSFTGHPDRPYQGQKCYQYMMGLSEQCPFCPMRELGSRNGYTTQVDNGQQVFQVKTMRIRWNGQDAFVEYATDITAVARVQQIFENQLHALLASTPEAQGVFHMDLTANRVLAMTGTSANVEPLRSLLEVDTLIQNIASFVPDSTMRQQFLDTFHRDALQQAYRSGRIELQQELLSFYDDKSIRWTRMTARLLTNPGNGDLEAILYGMDISREKNYEQRIATAEQENSALLELTRQDPLTGLYSKNAFAQQVQSFLERRPAHDFALAFLDLDYFKTINDTLGHLEGDRVLNRAARMLHAAASPGTLLARFGGDEFCALIPACDYDTLQQKLDGVHRTLRQIHCVESDPRSLSLSASIGAVFCDAPAPDYPALLDLADKALYCAKERGRDQHCIWRLSEQRHS